MAFIQMNFSSKELGVQTPVNVLLPEAENMGDKPLPTMYLLHGLFGDYSDWVRKSRVEEYAKRYRIAVVMPSAGRSFYTDMAHGYNYYTYITRELPRVMEGYFPLSREREGRFVCGLSMGGYGAMKIGLREPSRYAAVGCFSGPLMMQDSFRRANADAMFMNDMRLIFGTEEALRSGPDNLCNPADALVASGEQPPYIYAACGTEDFLYSANEAFMDMYGDALGIEYIAEPGDHEWGFWDRHVEIFLTRLPLERVGMQ